MHLDSLTMITCSYAPDVVRCRRLCRSIDRYVPEDIEHCVIVPRRDMPLFADLHRGRRRLLATEDVVPAGFRQLPVSSRWWLSEGGWPVRGWIMQQITKLSASNAADTELILFADSDIVFIRPFDLSRYYRNRHLRLHRIPDAEQTGDHLRWHHRAADLLGVPQRYFGSDYVGQLITWRRSNLRQLQARLEQVHQVPWHQPIARSLRFSEYTLYGAYVEHVVGDELNGHFPCSEDTCHCCWFEHDVRELSEGRKLIDASAQALLVQSNLGLKPAQEATLFNNLNHYTNFSPRVAEQ